LAKYEKNIVGGIECYTPSEYIKKKNLRDEGIKSEIREQLPKVKFYSEKHPYNELTLKEKQSEENEFIAYQRLKTDVHRDYKGNFTWLIFVARREESLKKSEPMFFFKYGGLFNSSDLPKLLDLCWELEVYGQCIFYDQKRYDSKTLKQLIHDFKSANKHIINARNIIIDRTTSDRVKIKQQSPKQMAMFGRSQNVGFTFAQSLIHELEIMEYELDDLVRIARADSKLPAPEKDKEIIKLQYFVYLGEEIFKQIAFQYYFKHLDLSNETTYNSECKKFIVELASMLPEIQGTNIDQIRSAYDRRKKYKMKYLGLYQCETEQEFTQLLKKISL